MNNEIQIETLFHTALVKIKKVERKIMNIFLSIRVLTFVLVVQKNCLIQMFFWVLKTDTLVEK